MFVTQGSALARATLGSKLVNAFGVSARIAKNLWSLQVDVPH